MHQICHLFRQVPFHLRFNSSIRVFASALFSVQMLLYMAIVVYAPSIALIQVQRDILNKLSKSSILLFLIKVTGFLHGIKYDVEIACAIIYAVCIFYSCVGGIKVFLF